MDIDVSTAVQEEFPRRLRHLLRAGFARMDLAVVESPNRLPPESAEATEV